MTDWRRLEQRSHRRFNPLTGEWVLVSPHRMQRPWQGMTERVAKDVVRPSYDPTCYLCPGNVRAAQARNPAYRGTFVFDNDFAALQAVPDARESIHEGPNERSHEGTQGDATGDDGLLVARPESGICRVICFSPRHDQTLPDMSVDAIRGVVDTWTEEYERLGSRPEIHHVQIFENKGELMGCSNPHPHGQIWAQASIPLTVARETERLAHHYQRHHRTLLEDYIRIELRDGDRVVCENDAFIVVVPFWAVWPFETLVISRRPVPHLSALNDGERTALADIIQRLTIRYDHLFDVSFPYSAGIHQAPTDGAAHPEWHLHMHFNPPLLRSSIVRKFLVGYEMMAEPQRDLTAESAAERLRALPEAHDITGPQP